MLAAEVTALKFNAGMFLTLVEVNMLDILVTLAVLYAGNSVNDVQSCANPDILVHAVVLNQGSSCRAAH